MRFSDFSKKTNEILPVTDFNPAEIYLRELRDNYGEFALFFYDSFGGDVIAVLWRAEVKELSDFKLSKFPGRKFDGSKLVFNFDAVIEDFKLLGEGLVRTIEKSK